MRKLKDCTRAVGNCLNITGFMLFLLLLLLVGSGSAETIQPSEKDTPIKQARIYEREKNYQQAADMFLLTAKKMPQNSGEPWRVKAAEMAWIAGNSSLAGSIIDTTDENHLNEAMTARFRLIKARIARKNGAYAEVIQQLQVPTTNLSSSIQKQINSLITDARRHNPNLPTAVAEVASSDIYWNNLSVLPPTKINKRLAKADSIETKGWLELANIKQSYSGPELTTAVYRWERSYPGHPATQTAIELRSQLTSSYSSAINQIAVLLPRSGQYSGVTNVIIEGILNAQQDLPVSQRPEIKIYDSAPYEISSLYQQAIAEGAQFILGPMDKKKVDQLTSSNTSVPILTLNYGNKPSLFNPGLFQYALLPEDEAHIAAEQISSQGYVRTAVLAPDSHWGKRVAEAFIQQAEMLGLEIVAEGKFNPGNQNMSSVVQETFKVDGKKVEVETDAIFIAATPSQGRLLKPLLKFHFLGHVPVFSTSHIYSGVEDSGFDRDLDGIEFPEIPWILKKGSINAQQEKLPVLKELDETTQQHPRLYAFGYDALNLGVKLASNSASNLNLSGLTGNLYIDSANRVHRLMGWAKFKRGVPVAQSLPGTYQSN